MRPDSSIHWNAYPALLLASGFGLGIWLASWLEWMPYAAWVGIAVGGGALAVGGIWWKRHRLVSLAPLLILAGTGSAVIATGGARRALDRSLPTHHIVHLVGARPGHAVPAALEGRVVDAPAQGQRGTHFTLRVERTVVRGDTASVTGDVRTNLWQSPWDATSFPLIRQGDQVYLRGQLSPVPRRRNPADFDYGAYLKRHGIYATLDVNDADSVRIVGHRRGWFLQRIVDVRAYVGAQLDRWIEGDEPRAVLRALLLGDRSRIEESTRNHFTRTGLMHVLAVSGLHVFLVGMILYGLLRPLLARLGLRWRPAEVVRALLTIGLLGSYMVLAGSRPSIVRAVVMAGLFLGGAALQRSSHPLNTLGVAGLVLLLARPAALFDAGFQLSFAAVGAIITLNPRIRALIPHHRRSGGLVGRGITLVTVSLAATLGTAPVLLYHFGYVSLAGLFLNLLAIPLTGLSMIAGLATTLAGGWSPVLGSGFGSAANVLTRGLLETAALGETAFSWAALWTTVRAPWILVAMVGTLAAAAQWPRPRLRWKLVILTLLTAVFGAWSGVLRSESGARLEVIFFDVGQGDAALVTFPSGRHMLVDAGPRTPYTNQARRTILPHLRRHGIHRLDAVVISHSDRDHLGGLPALLRSVAVGRVVFNGRGASSALYRETVHVLDSLHVPVESAAVGDTFRIDPSARVQVLAPPREMDRKVSGDNDASIVLRIVYGDTRLLFTGDIEASAERWLVRRFESVLKSDVVKVPHHGSQTSSSPSFVERVLPDTSAWVVVSAGRENQFGFPSEEVVSRWEARGGAVLETTGGAVWLHSDGTRVRRKRWR